MYRHPGMGLIQRTKYSGSKYPDCPRDTIGLDRWSANRALARQCRGIRRGLALSLVLTALAGCETSAPVTPIEAVSDEAEPVSAIELAATGVTDVSDLLLSESCERENDHLCAVESLARFLDRQAGTGLPAGRASGKRGAPGGPPGELARQVLHDRLWRLTAALPPVRVAVLADGQSHAPLWRLRRDLSGSQSAHEQAERLLVWMARWPGHPFVELPPDNLARLLQSARRPAPVGLFVPLSGPLSGAGRAVRDGFIAAYLHDSAPLKAAVRIYDTASTPIATLYEQSLTDGVEFIVGPLSKRRLEALHRLNPELPVLGLNYLDDGPAENRAGHAEARPETLAPQHSRQPFMQLGLAIEDEAETIIDRLLAENVERFLAIHSAEDWALRGIQTLTEAWPYAMDTRAFVNVQTLTESVGEGMQVTESMERRDALERLLGRELEFLPRARADLDGVVAFVDEIEAAALAPALKFHYASHLPVYASSQSVRDPSSLSELNGFRVVDMPFNLQAEPLWSTVRKAFGAGGRSRGNAAALHALGIDAFRIVDLRAWVADGEPVYGATGTLLLADGERIRRMLAWATVAGGAIHPAPEAARPRLP